MVHGRRFNESVMVDIGSCLQSGRAGLNNSPYGRGHFPEDRIYGIFFTDIGIPGLSYGHHGLGSLFH